VYESLYKDAPSVGDVHVNGPDWRAGYKQPVPDMGDLGPGRSAEDIEAERRAKARTATAPVGTIALKGDIAKVDVKHGLAFGFGMICSKGGQPYYDTQNDHVPEDSMIEAAVDFMRKSREAHDMHNGVQQGDVVFAMPITPEVRKFIMESDETGLLIGMAPSDEVLGRFADGTYTGFSMGGSRIEDEVAV
jgi:hypothetical protein